MGKNFVALMGTTPRAISKIIKKGQTMSIIDKDEQGYFLVDPLFKEFLKKYKSFYSEKL